MLYKKAHRQYLREWRIGRRFRFYDDVNNWAYRITSEPYIKDNYIVILRGSTYNTFNTFRALIDLYDGKMYYKDKVVWLN